MEALETSCKLIELHVSLGNCMEAYVTALQDYVAASSLQGDD